MSVYQQYLVNLQTPTGSIQITVSAMCSSDAARTAEAMIAGSRATRIEMISPR
jgi:hypothetical protein